MEKNTVGSICERVCLSVSCVQRFNPASLITQCSIKAIRSLSDRVHLRGGVDGGVARGTLRDAGTVVDDVLLAVGAFVALLLSLALVVKILAEGERDAAPALVGEVVFGTALDAGALVLEPATGHTMAGRVRLEAAAQALVVAALVILGAGPVFALSRTHCRHREEHEKLG